MHPAFRKLVPALLLIMAAVVFPHSARANCDGLSDTCRTVVDSIDTLQSGDFSDPKYTKISVTCFHAVSPTVKCAGGGDFDYLNSGFLTCTSALADGVIIIRDSRAPPAGPDCFIRRNFGLNGIVDARQCGVWGDGVDSHTVGTTTYYDADLLNNCITVASGAGYHIVTTGGGVIADNKEDITVPDNISLTCGGTGASSAASNDYRIASGLSKAIVLDPTNTNVTGQPLTVRITGRNAAYYGCTEVAGAGADGSNIFSPSIWFPGCNAATTGSCDTGTPTPFRSSMLEASAFNPNQTAAYNIADSTCANTAPLHCGPASQSVGVTLDGAPNAIVRDVTILGFGTCLALGTATSAAPGTLVENVSGDCNTGIKVNLSNAPSLHATSINPLLTGAPYSAWTIVQLVSSGTYYQVTARIGDNTLTDTSFNLRNNDTVWIGTGSTTSAQSAIGRWQIACSHGSDGTCTVSPCPSGGGNCQTFTLTSSKSTAFSLGGQIRNVPANGVPASAITGLSGADLRYLAAGQTVSDSGSGGLNCIPAGTTVTAVWPLRQTAYLSQPPAGGPTCSGSDTITFQDGTYPLTPPDCGLSAIQNGCVFVDAGFRFGDAYDVHNTGGATFSDCTGFEHMVAFHANTGSNKARFVNCATENSVTLPDGSLWAMASHADDDDNDRQNIVGLLIDGQHSNLVPPPDPDKDACAVLSENTIFGQHRPVGIVVNTQCSNESKIVNGELSVDNVQNNGIGFEVDDGQLLLSNSSGSTGNAFVSGLVSGTGSPQTGLRIGTDSLSQMTLYAENNTAAAQIAGCGNTFASPTPYLCAPSSFTQLPGGRLTLTNGQPVMTSDVTGAGKIYYEPFKHQQVPIFSPASGTFGLVDIGSNGLSLTLNSSSHVAGKLYDVFVETLGSAGGELCTGPAWASNTGRASTGGIIQINGVWVNASDITCTNSTATEDCQPSICTYVGTFYTKGAAIIAQQFGPVAGSGGGAPCLCLYNAYNQIILGSASADTNANYAYGTPSWRLMDGSASNSISVVDGLGQMQISAQLNDLMNNSSGSSPRSAQMGILFGSSILPGTPALAAQANSVTTKGSYTVTATHPPIQGYWQAQAVENVTAGSGSANFGGSPFQQISVQLSD